MSSRLAWPRVVAAFGHRCAYCLATNCALTRDHYVPVSKGGTPARDGWRILGHVVPACSVCNGRKAAEMPAELRWLPRERQAYIEFVLDALANERSRHRGCRRTRNVR